MMAKIREIITGKKVTAGEILMKEQNRYKKDRQVVLSEISTRSNLSEVLRVFLYIPEKFRGDKEIVSEATSRDVSLFKFAFE